MSILKTEKDLQLLQQIIHSRNDPEFNTWGEFLEQLAENTADTLDSISGSGLLVGGEAITTYVGISLRILSTLLKIFIILDESTEEREEKDIILFILDTLIIVSLTALTFVLGVLAAAIVGMLLAAYFFMKAACDVYQQLTALFLMQSFYNWLETLLHLPDDALLDDNTPQEFIEQLFFCQILWSRSAEPIQQQQYEKISKITAAMPTPEKTSQLLALYQDMDQHFCTLHHCISLWQGMKDEIILADIHHLQLQINNINDDIQGYFHFYQQMKIQDARNNEIMLIFAETSIGFYITAVSLILALIGLLMCISVMPAVTPLLYLAPPLIFGITIVVLTVAQLIANHIFDQQDAKHIGLEILEKANSDKYSTLIAEELPKPMNNTTFF